MTDPERLFDSGTQQQRALLGAARQLRATSASRQRGLVALGVASAVGLTPAAALAAKAGKGLGLSLARLIATHWGTGLVVVGVGVGVTSVHLLRQPREHSPAAASAVGPSTRATAKPAFTAALTGSQPTPEPNALAPQPQAPDERRVVVPRAPKTSELELVDRARQRLTAGDGTAALQALEERARTYPAGKLGPEASVLRIQSLVATGRRSQAQQEARRFLEQHPTGLLSHRVRRLLEEQRSP